MADGLAEALLGLNFSPAQDPYGLAQQAVATSTPSLISPYASTGKAIGIGLGSVLLQSLLGYQARQSALQDTLQANTLANQMLQMQTPEERTALIGQEGVPSAIGSRLSTLATALTAQEKTRENALALSGGQEVAKLKAMADYFNTPEGQQAREFELNKIREEAAARSSISPETRLELARLRNEGIIAGAVTRGGEARSLEVLRQAGKETLQTQRDAAADKRTMMSIEARSGDAEKQREWKAEQNKIQTQYSKELAQYKAQLGIEAAGQKEQLLNDIRIQNMKEGDDADTALLNAKATIAQRMQKELLQEKDRMGRERMQEYNQAIIERTKLRKQLDAEYPTLTAKVKDDAANATAFGNLAKTLAGDIRKISSYPEYRAIKAMSALGDEQLKSRTIDIADRLTRLRSGMATRGAEDEKLEKIALGDLTVGPQEAASILERLANDTLQYAADKVATQTQSPTNLVNMMRQSAQSNTQVSLQPRIYQGGSSEQGNAADIFVTELKSKYGADWKIKMSPDEKAAAAALIRAGRQ
jgi:hypothetical protein